MYGIIVTDPGEEQRAVEGYLTDELGLGEETAEAIANGEQSRVTTVDDGATADEIAGELEERGATAEVEREKRTHTITGEVTFEGPRPERTVSVEAVDIRGRSERELGRTKLPSDATYTIQYRAVPDRRIDLVVRAVVGQSTLAESEPIPDAGLEETVPLTVPASNVPVPDVEQGNDMFDFMMLRPPDASAGDTIRVEGGEASPLMETLTTARSEGDRKAMIDAALSYMESEDFVSSLDTDGGGLESFGERLASMPAPTEGDVRAAIEESFGAPPAAVVDDPSFRRARDRLRDSLAAVSVAPGVDGDVRAELARGVRLGSLVERMADPDSIVDDIERFLDRPIALPEGLLPLPSVRTGGPIGDRRQSSSGDGISDEVASLHRRLESIRTAKAELFSAELATARSGSGTVEDVGDEAPLQASESETRAGPGADHAEQTGVEQSERGDAERDADPDEDGDEDDEPFGDGGAPRLRAPDGMLDMLSPETRDLLDEAATGEAPTDIDTAMDRLRGTETELGSEFLRRTLEPMSGRTIRIGDTFRTVSETRDGATEGEGEAGVSILDPQFDTPLLPEDSSEMPRIDTTPAMPPLVNVLGIGVMKTVKRETARYEMGELAHVENVLEGEYKERVHEREEVTEETLITEEETTETQKRDLQTSERFEMERESQETMKQKSSIEAGVKVSASYGPTVEVDAYTDYSRSQARERSERASRQYSREVTKQTVDRIQRRKFRREVEKKRQRVTETNTHELDNKGDDEHISGIYRWVDKIVRAQVFNQGKRLMLEFIVPEPAAFYRQAKASNPAEQIMMQKPEPPTYASISRSNGTANKVKRPLEPDDLNNANYQYYASRYGATDISPPPKRVIRQATKLVKKGTVPTDSKKPIYKTGTVTMPEGYRAASASVAFADVVRNKRDWRWKLQATVGDQAASVGWRGTWGVGGLSTASDENVAEDLVDAVENQLPAGINIPRGIEEDAEDAVESVLRNTAGISPGSQQGEYTEDTYTYERQLGMSDNQRPVALDAVQSATPQTVALPDITGGAGSSDQGGVPVTVFAYNVLGFGVTVTVACYRTAEHYKQWQIETYKQIRTAFENELSKYRKKLAEARAEEGVDIEGNAPEENRRIEREELKRLAISMMRKDHIDVDAVENITDPEDDIESIPGVDFSELRSNRNLIQFFEQAFEWTYMTYVFYPYFWTDRDDWPELEQYEATDPAFESFLRAGAARVIVPVRPGFFDSVLWFLQSGELDFDPPKIGDPQYVPIVTEIKEQQGIDEDARPVQDPWAVRVPTELVKLQQSEKLPDLPPDV